VCRTQEFRPKPCQGKAMKKGIKNKEDRQRNSQINMAGLRNGIAERADGCCVRGRFGRTERCSWRDEIHNGGGVW